MRALVFDTETTGLIQNRTIRKALWPEIIEFGSITIDWDTFHTLDQYSILIKPSKKLEEDTIKITGITDDMLKDELHFVDHANEIKSRIEESDIVIAHNASYDVEMIDMEFERLGLKINWPRVICTVEQTLNVKGYRMKLSELHEYLFGMEHEDAHRAMTDVKALTRIVKELKRREML